ncbi:MAG: radical SAM family heme chaperone HemW [Lachnospiraceae bacterium]|nr:radical SAM family heme chaperone HemW [Lachnospiraceae bacterium]
MKDLSIYIHIPFCVRKCLYCDFLSFPVGKIPDLWKKPTIKSYANLLCQEVTASAPSYREHRVISVFWGGGTPSLLPAEEVSSIMDVIRERYQVAQDAEITMEMNPETVDGGKMKQYITAGINRISIGLQSADDRELSRIGRIHDYRSFLTAYDLARRNGFHNINVDLMAALPEQSISSYERTLEQVSALAPEHISAYSLILEEGTPLYERQSEYRFPTEEEDREMYLLTREFLASKGYHRYEISNYARKGYECRHNKVYWQRGDYVGFGLGASSMVQNVRWSNPHTLEAYTIYTEQLSEQCAADSECVRRPEGQASYEQKPEAAYIPDKQVLTRQEQMEEFMFLGLRMVCGVSAAEFARIFGRSIGDVYGQVIDNLCRQELLVRENDRIRLTDRGLDVSNYAMAQFLFD